MQDFNNFNWRDRTNANELSLSNISRELTLEELGGELLAGSGFEDEEPESDFSPAGVES